MTELNKEKISLHCLLACLYFLLLPTTIAINSAGNSFLKVATVPIAAYFVITLIFSKRVLHFNSIHLLLCLYTFSTLITLFISADLPSVSSVIGYFLNAALYLCITVVRYNKRELLLLEYTQVLMLVILVAITLLSNGSWGDRTTLMIFGQKCDPNYFIGFFIFPLSITFKKTLRSKYRLLYLILALLSLYCVFLSGSRGGLIAIIASIAAFALIYPKKATSKVVIFFGGFGILTALWLFVLPFLPENIVERMSITSVIESGGTGRLEIWKSMLDEIINSPDKLIFGRGIHARHGISLGNGWGEVVAHNHLLQVLYNQGVVGITSFLVLTLGCLLRCIGRRKTVAVAIIGMMALSISLTFDQTTRAFWNLVAYAALNFLESEPQASQKI